MKCSLVAYASNRISDMRNFFFLMFQRRDGCSEAFRDAKFEPVPELVREKSCRHVWRVGECECKADSWWRYVVVAKSILLGMTRLGIALGIDITSYDGCHHRYYCHVVYVNVDMPLVS